MFSSDVPLLFTMMESPLPQLIEIFFALRFTLWLVLKKKAFIDAVEKLPGPSLKESHALLAHLKTILDSLGTVPGRPGEGRLVDIFENWLKETKEYGICRIWAFHPYKVPFALSNVFISDPQILRQLVTDPKIAPKLVKDPRLFTLSEPLVGNSIFSLPDGPKWKHGRKFAVMAFRHTLLEHANQVIVGLLHEKVFPKWGHAKTVEIQEWAIRMAVESIGRVAFGFSFGGLDPQDNAQEESLYETFQVLKSTISRRGRSVPGIQYLPTRENFIFAQKSKRLNNVIWSILKERERAAKSDHHQDLLSFLMKEDSNMDVEDVFGNVRMFLLTGHDSTSTTVACALWELATHPIEQERLQNEVDALFDTVDGGIPSYKDLIQLPYLDAVAKETLRKHAPGGLGRETLEDITVRGSNGKEYTIPAGCSVFYFPGIASRLDSNFDRPDEFDPDRFFLNKGDPIKNAAFNPAYMPFSVGARACIGQPLAMAQIKCILAHVVRHYSLSRNANAGDPIRILLLTIKLHEALIDVKRRR